MSRRTLVEQYMAEEQHDALKYDSGKVRAGLMIQGFARALMEVAKISTFGANKYADNTWQGVEKKRYIDSTARHYLEYMAGRVVDDESGELTLAHLAWNVLCLLEKELEE